MVADLLLTHEVQDLAECRAVALELALKRSNIGSERVRNFADACASERHQQPDRLLDFLDYGPRTGIDHCCNKLPGVACEGRIGSRVFALQVRPVDNDSI